MKKFFKIVLIIFCCLVLIIASAIVWLNTKPGMNFVRGKAEAFLRGKLKTEVVIGSLGYGLPKYIVLENVLFKDQAKDTLLSVGKLEIDLDMLALLHKQVNVQAILLENATGNISRGMHDTDFNFSYIIRAFAGAPDTTTKKTAKSSSPFKIDVQQIKLDQIRFKFDDIAGGNRLALGLAHLDVRMKALDLDSMLFHVKSITLSGVQTTYLKDSSYLAASNDTSSSKPRLRLMADKVNLQTIAVHYSDNLNKLLFDLGLGTLETGVKLFDLGTATVAVNEFNLDNTNVDLKIGKLTRSPAIIDTIVKIDSTMGWTVTTAGMHLGNVNFNMDNENSTPTKAGLDYAHLHAKDLNLDAKNIRYTGDTIMGNIQHLAVKEHNGLIVDELKTDFFYNTKGVVLKGLLLQTPNTTLHDYAEVHYASLEDLKLHPGAMQIKLNFKNSTLAIPDLLQFAPFLIEQDFIRAYKNDNLKIDADISGSLNKLNIAKLNLAGFDNTLVMLNGKFNGLPEADKINYDLNIGTLQSSAKMLALFVPAKQLESVRVPDRFTVKGKIAGTILDYRPDVTIVTTDGDADIKGYLLLSPGSGKEKYDLAIAARNFNAGRVLKQDSLIGIFTATLNAKGTSFDPKKMASEFKGNIQSAAFNNYPYSGVKFNGKVYDKQGDLTLNSDDPSLSLGMTGHADFTGKYVAAKLDARIDSIDFQQLNLYHGPFRIHGLIHADFPELNPDYPRGVFSWKDAVIAINGQRYTPDSLIIISNPSADTGQNIYAYLDVMQARLMGKMPLSKIPLILQDHISKHYGVLLADSTKNTIAAKTDTTQLDATYNLTFLATITDKPMLHGFLPKLRSFDSIHIDASLTERDLALNVSVPQIIYDSSTVKAAVIQVRGTDSALTYKITADRMTYNQFDLWYADIHGNVDHDLITTNISLSDADKKERFSLAASMNQQGNNKVLQLLPGLKLDYNTWTVAQPNSITFSDSGYFVNNFEISNNGQAIKVNSLEQRPGATVKAEFNNFAIGNITRAISKADTSLAEGILSGNATYANEGGINKITADLGIKDLLVMGDTLGNLQVNAASSTADAIDTKVTLKGHGNDLEVKGTYFLKPVNYNQFDLDLKLTSLNLHSFESMSGYQFKNSTGVVKGDLKLQGSIEAPQITGSITTDKLTTTVTQINSVFTFPHETITFADYGVVFNKFTVQDSAGSKAIVNGKVNIQDLVNPEFDFTISAKKWRAIHSRAEHNKVFYGDLYLNANVRVKGTTYMPVVDGNIDVLKGTDIVVVTPESNPELQSRKGIVVFKNMHDTSASTVLTPRKTDSTKRRIVHGSGSNVNVNITVDKQAQMSIVLDQASGDFIKVRGVAALNTYFLPDGTIGLTGNYELTEGAYQLNYNFIKRKFLIKQGSTITFSGDPVKNTILDVTAVYATNIPPYDLVQKEIQDPIQLNYFKQRLPFNVELNMKGPILQPALTFDVILPENKVYPLSSDQIELVRGKLNQLRGDTSQLNKQVFAVLILNRFVADDPFSNGASTSIGNTALQSVSRFIGEQLNQAAGRYIKGVDLSVDLATTEDYTTGDLRQRTDLNLAASKRLLNDRLKLTVGNDFELDGPQSDNNNQSSYIPSDLSADYLLSSDGKYTLQAYRKNYNEGVLQGFVTETGLNFIVSVDYNKFKNVLKKKGNKNPDVKN